MADYYAILGVSKNAGEKEIRGAFRRSARRYHPDLNPGDKQAEEKFKQINEAYEVLSDPGKRKKYDRYGDQWKRADQFEAQYARTTGWPSDFGTTRGGSGPEVDFDLFGGIDDLLGGLGGTFRRRRSGRATARRRVEAPVTVTLEEAFSGAKRHVTVTPQDGQKERRIEVTIPPGVDNGSVVRISLDKENQVFMNVSVSPHDRFERKGNDLHTEVRVPFEEAVLGGETEVRTLKGRVRMKVAPESQNGQKIRLAGQGMPVLGKPETRGDLYVSLHPTLPKNLTDEEKELVNRFKELRSERGNDI